MVSGTSDASSATLRAFCDVSMNVSRFLARTVETLDPSRYLKIIHTSPHFIAVSKPAHTICQDERGNPRSLSNLLRHRFPDLFLDHVDQIDVDHDSGSPSPSPLPVPLASPSPGNDSIIVGTEYQQKGKQRKRVPPYHDPKGVHRLDALVTGCVLYGTSVYGTRRIALAFKNRKVEKVYLAVLRPASRKSLLYQHESGVIDAAGRTTAWKVIQTVVPINHVHEATGIQTTDGNGKLKGNAVRQGRGHTQEDDALCIVVLRPVQGRTHQLRIHAAHDLDAPVLYDTRYPIDPSRPPPIKSATDTPNQHQNHDPDHHHHHPHQNNNRTVNNKNSSSHTPSQVQGHAWRPVREEGIALHCARMSLTLGLTHHHTVSCLPPDIGIWRTLRVTYGVNWGDVIDAA